MRTTHKILCLLAVAGLFAGLEGTLKDRVEALEARILRETLIRHRWNKSRAADELGLSRVGLRKPAAAIYRLALDRLGVVVLEHNEMSVSTLGSLHASDRQAHRCVGRRKANPRGHYRPR